MTMRNYNDTPRAAARSWPSPHHHHHQVRVAGEGRRVVAPPCPRSTARRQRSPVGRVGSFRSWSSHLFRGRPGGRLHVRSGGRLDSLFERLIRAFVVGLEKPYYDVFFLPRDAMHPRYYSHGPVSVCPSVRLSVTSRCSTKTAKRRITQTTPHDSPGTLVF